MLEMAIVAPVLLVLLFGIMEFGLAFGQWQTLSNAAREGARIAVVWRDPASNPTCVTDAKNEATNAVQSYASTTISGTVNVTFPGQDPCTTGNLVTVRAETPFTFLVTPGLAGLSLPNPFTLRGESTMRNE